MKIKIADFEFEGTMEELQAFLAKSVRTRKFLGTDEFAKRWSH